MQALRGIGLLITNGATISITNDAFTDFSQGSLFGVPNLFLMVLLVAIPAYIFLHHSKWGRYLFAIGSNAEAARLSGVNTKAMIYVAYVLSAFCAAFVGILLGTRIGIGNPTQGEGWELQAIASSVIGGTSLFGAIGSIYGPLLGSFILTTINNGANLLNLNSFWQRIITGSDHRHRVFRQPSPQEAIGNFRGRRCRVPPADPSTGENVPSDIAVIQNGCDVCKRFWCV
jgi:Ribose/xylose/arabinose/galactoside ABC-type transport systems, permease components